MERGHVLEGAFPGHDVESTARAREFDHSLILKRRESNLDVVAQTKRYINDSTKSTSHDERKIVQASMILHRCLFNALLCIQIPTPLSQNPSKIFY